MSLMIIPALAASALSLAAPDVTVTPRATVAGLPPSWVAPARAWNEAMPVGNGRSGAMVFGGVARERIQLDEISLWARSPTGRVRHPAPELLGKARTLWFAGDVRGCQDLMQREFMSEDLNASHQTAGDLAIAMAIDGAVTDYVRSLDVTGGGAATVSFRTAAGAVTRTTTATPWTVDTVIVQGGEPAPVTLALGRQQLAEGGVERVRRADGEVDLVMRGRARNGDFVGGRYQVVARISAPQGTIEDADAPGALSEVGVSAERSVALRVTNARRMRVSVAVATDFDGRDPASIVESLLASNAAALADPALAAAESSRLFGRDIPCTIRIGESMLAAPVPALLERVRGGSVDPALVNAYLDFGRHLARSASRDDPRRADLPANLQGLWNEHILAPWNADYHTNINLQMNYWPAEQVGLGSRVVALTDYIDRLAADGAVTAKAIYGAGGWVCHHTSDPWGFTLPIGNTVWGLWPHGGGWLVRHCWEHYCYTLDREYLERRAFPLMRGACEFYLDWLTPDPTTGKLVGGPSTSPENTFILPNGSRADVGMGNAMDQEIVWDCLTNLVDAARVLGLRDDPVVRRATEALARLAWPTIGEDGRLQEWSRPFAEAEPGHRHVSHLYGVYPSRQFMAPDRANYLAAARKSLETRLANGGGHTGWSRAWLISLTARLRDGEAAYGHLTQLLGHSTLPSLLDDHPPFQIDGNFGGLAGVCEMLMQSHEMRWNGETPAFVIDLLPALPKAWPDGSATLCARGAVLVRMEWSEGRLRETVITPTSAAGLPPVVRLRAPGSAGSPQSAAADAPLDVANVDGVFTIRVAPTATTIHLLWK